MIYAPLMPHGENRRFVLWIVARSGEESDGMDIGEFFVLESIGDDAD